MDLNLNNIRVAIIHILETEAPMGLKTLNDTDIVCLEEIIKCAQDMIQEIKE